MKFYCVTADYAVDGDDKYDAHEFDSQEEAEAFSDGIQFVSSDRIYSLGVYSASSVDEAIAAANTEDELPIDTPE